MSNTALKSTISSLFDAMLADTPMLVQTRQALPSLDWRQVRPDQIEAMINRLAEAGTKIWLI